MSWRIVLGAGVAAVTAFAGLPIGIAIALGAGLYVGSVFAAMPRVASRPAIDPFTLSEPWRRLMQQAQVSGRKLRSTADGLDDGPLRQQLRAIVDQLDHGLDEAWLIARRGDEIDEVVRTLDPVRLRSKLATLQAESTDADAAIASVEQQLATADRLKQQSAETADALRVAQTRLDELVARAGEVRVGTVDTETYAHEVDEVVVKLEALHQAVQETRTT